MIPTNFEYHAPSTLNTAFELIAQYGEDCKILSGGHSLIPVLKLRLASPSALIDISRIKEINHITLDGDRLRIGALATHASIAGSPIIQKHCPLLSDAAQQIGDQQVRNRGTIGGSLVHADPAADWPAAIVALDASITVRSQTGERVIEAADFFVDMLTSSIDPGEIVTEISVALPPQPNAASYQKVAQAASGFAIIGVAVQLDLDQRICRDVRIGVTGLAVKAYRALTAEQALRGKQVDEAAIKKASSIADQEASDTMDDIHASGEYRRHLTRIYTGRGLRSAAGL